MRSNFLIVDRSVLPDYLEKVVEARGMLRDGVAKDVSDAAKLAGISRSTYYKYKDFVFAPDDATLCKKAVFGMNLRHEQGILSDVLNTFSSIGANILTINQSLPIHGNANVVLSVDMTHVDLTTEELITKLRRRKGVTSMKLIAVE